MGVKLVNTKEKKPVQKQTPKQKEESVKALQKAIALIDECHVELDKKFQELINCCNKIG